MNRTSDMRAHHLANRHGRMHADRAVFVRLESRNTDPARDSELIDPSWSRPRGSTATTRWRNRSSRTSQAARWLTCPPGFSPRTRPWLPIAAMAHNLVRAAGALASLPFAKARAATVRRDLIAVPAPPATAGATSPPTGPTAGTANTNGRPSGMRPAVAARRSGLTSPGTGPHPRRPPRPPAIPFPSPEPRATRRTSQRQDARTPESPPRNSPCRNQAGNELPELAGGSRLRIRIRDRAGLGSWCQSEGRVLIRDQEERVGDDAVVPAKNAFDEGEYAARVAAGEQDSEPGHDHCEERRDVQEEQHDVVRDGQQPFDQRQPPVEVGGRVRVAVVQFDPLVVIGGRVGVIHQGQVGSDPVAEPLELKIPVEPPPGILLLEQDHQQWAEEQQSAGGRAAVGHGGVTSRRLPGSARYGAEHDRDRDDHEDTEE